ncbi:MAG: hypothetical protein SF052_13280 [Bacteroidia bacterium]|nr:hypothetical protein [Bacteroidia bacterium]
MRLRKRIPIFLMVFFVSAFKLVSQNPEPSGYPQEVLTGTYLINVFDLDINRHSFYVDCYIWFKWKGDLDPMNIEFVNAVDKWGATMAPFYEEPKQLEDGYFYNGMRYEGRFYHAFNLEKFPLDHHFLDMQIENVDYSIDSLIYIPDTHSAYVREDFHLPGWDILGLDVKSESHTYPVNFGDMEKTSTGFSNFMLQLHLRRPMNYFLLKLLLPVLIVIIASLGALLIHPASIDARISLPIGGLLSAVFLQQSYSAALPDVGYMVLMDKIYLLVYALIAAVMLRVVVAGNRVTGLKKAADTSSIMKRDRWMIIGFMLAFSLGILILVY